MTSERNPELRTAWEFVENTGRSIFLTGKADEGFSVEGYLKYRQMAMLEAADDQNLRRALKPQKPPKEKTTEVTLRLFNQGMTPEQIAAERGISPNTVFSHLARRRQGGYRGRPYPHQDPLAARRAVGGGTHRARLVAVAEKRQQCLCEIFRCEIFRIKFWNHLQVSDKCRIFAEKSEDHDESL